MPYVVNILEEDKENIEEVIDIVDRKIGIKIPQKKLVGLLIKNPKVAAEVILQNIKQLA